MAFTQTKSGSNSRVSDFAGCRGKNAGHGRMLERLIYTMPFCGELIHCLAVSVAGFILASAFVLLAVFVYVRK